MKIGLATDHAHPDLTDDDRPLIELLRLRDVVAEPVRWDSLDVTSGGFDAIVLRSTWDYHHQPARFGDWLDVLDRAGIPLWNPTALVRWNMHKRYLADLRRAGILIPETEWVVRGDQCLLSDVLRQHGWRDAIVKPAISASATDTWKVSDESDSEPRYAALVRRADVLVQEIVPEIASDGEWSLVFIGGEYSHATVKRPRAGDFRVQVELGGTAVAATAPREVVSAGTRVAQAIPSPWLYARIDGVVTSRGFMLMEVECIEPHLFFGHDPDARDRFVAALIRLVR